MINKMAMLLLCCHQKQKCCGGMGCTVVQQVSSCRTYVAIIEQLWNRESNPVNQLMCVCVFKSLPVKEIGRERVHCTMHESVKMRYLLIPFGVLHVCHIAC